MYFRRKKAGAHTYIQIAESRWEDGRSRQRVLATLGRLDRLQETGQIDALLASGSRFAESMTVLSEIQRGDLPTVRTRHLGAPLLFERLWKETGCREIIEKLLADRQFEFPVERAIFLEVLHRLVSPGSDRSAYEWRQDYRIDGVEDLELHHAYRAMAWLGEVVETAAKPTEVRTTKDFLEEKLFDSRRDLFTEIEIVFFDTTSFAFEGEGGETLGQLGHSKDHRPDLKQMVVGVVLDQEGRPLCCELWPGNTTDVGTLLPIVDRLGQRFGIRQVCIAADRGMISKKTLEKLDEDSWPYIVGARMRSRKEIREEVLADKKRFQVVHPRRKSKKKQPSPLKVKDVWIEDRRYVVCMNEEQARKDAADRKAILAALEDRLRSGAKSLVGNRGFRRYLKAEGQGLSIDPERVESDERYDGKWVLATNTDHDAAEVALAYKQLWMVEDVFRSMKSLLATRPIYHRTDEAIRGHVFCSFLALVLRQELEDRAAARGVGSFEWASLMRDLERLNEVEVEKDGKRFVMRSETSGVAGKVLQAAGVALPPTIRQVA